MFNEAEFRKAVQNQGFTLGEVAKYLKINPSTLYRKMKGESDFYRFEINALCQLLHIENPKDIFFA